MSEISDQNLTELQDKLGFIFRNKSLLKKALTHKSVLNEDRRNKTSSNERLEFLGDAILQFLSSEYLFKTYPEKSEGMLTAIRSSVVNTESLYAESSRLELGKYLIMSPGEEKSGGRTRKHILANTFESLIGAMYLQKGVVVCRNFLINNLFYKVDDIVANKKYIDKKSHFQEIAQERFEYTPVYKVMDKWGPDHDKMFKSAVYIKDVMIAEGEGTSKQRSETAAAENGLKIILNESFKI